MNLENLIKLVAECNSKYTQNFIDFLLKSNNPIDAGSNSHLTVSGILIYENKILLIKHKKLGKFIQLGGHFEDTLCPYKNIEREIFEESGIKSSFISKKILTLHIFEINSHHIHYDICFSMKIDKEQISEIHKN